MAEFIGVFQVHGISPSAQIIHARSVQAVQTRKDAPLVSIAADKRTRILSPQGKPIALRQLMPGMRVRVRGERRGTSGDVLASEVRLLSYEIHLRRLRVIGRAVRSSKTELVVQIGKRRMRIQRWPGGIRAVGVDAKAFHKRGFAAVPAGADLQARGWLLEDDLLLASYLHIMR
ncbi:MAG: hypothetical protein RMK45_06120 [Armatimonadota bacterium]|nr:hypothetical protein [Armatimonadota bacterium]